MSDPAEPLPVVTCAGAWTAADAVAARGECLASLLVHRSETIAGVEAKLARVRDATKSQTRTWARAISALETHLAQYETIPSTGLALFSGHVRDATGASRLVSVAFEPESALEHGRFGWDTEFFVPALGGAAGTLFNHVALVKQ